VKIAVEQVKRQGAGGTIFGNNKSTGEAQSSWRDTVSLAVVVLVVLLTHSELAAHLSKLFLQSFTRAKRSLVWTCADPRCFALSRARVIDYGSGSHRSASNFWNMITKSNVTCAFPSLCMRTGARSRAGAWKPAPAVAPCSMWAWARPKFLQSGDWTPDHEPLSSDPFLDA
jgi:hypothetical protein